MLGLMILVNILHFILFILFIKKLKYLVIEGLIIKS